MRWIAACLLAVIASAASARDGGGIDRPHVCDMPTSSPNLIPCQNWVSTIQRPDYPGASCCGDADAFIADDFEIGADGELYAIITADYPDNTVPGIDLDDGSYAPPPFTVHRGQKFLIPKEKINNHPDDTNRSGHGVVFLIPANGSVLCYRFPPLI